MLVVFSYMDCLYEATVPLFRAASFGAENTLVPVHGMEHDRVDVIGGEQGVTVKCSASFGLSTKSAPYDTPIPVSEKAMCFVTVCKNENMGASCLALPPDCVVQIGRKNTDSIHNHVIIDLPFISRKHMRLERHNGRLKVEDLGSFNGIYLNGRKVSSATMENGDELSVFTVKIRYENSELYFLNVGDKCLFMDIPQVLSGEKCDSEPQQKKGASFIRYRRSPRTQSRLPHDEIILASPPMKQPEFDGKTHGIMPSILSSGAMLAASVFTGVASPALLAARAAGLIFPITGALSARARTKEQKEKLEAYEKLRQKKYGDYIAEQQERIAAVAIAQRDIRTEENPDPDTCIRFIEDMDRRIWERSPKDPDFLDVRIGMGYEKLCVPVKSRAEVNGVQMEDDELRRLAEHIVESTSIVDQVPARVSLLEHTSIGVVGDRSKVVQLIRNMILELVTAHCPEDVRLIGIFDEEEREAWESIRWFPHIWDQNKQFRFLAFQPSDTCAVCNFFTDVLQERKALLEQSHSDLRCLPHCVFLFGSRRLMEKQQLMKHLFSEDKRMGITSLFLYDDLYHLPFECEYIIDLSDVPGAYDRRAVNERKLFTLDPPVRETDYNDAARKLSAVKMDGIVAAAGIPNGISFLQGYGVRKVEQLNAFERWRSNQGAQSLAAPVGVMEGGRILSLDIDEAGHGPHGLVAGTTGSGKSELLQTWILSMCLNYHPYDVSFVIIDYKGGGMANLLEPLPHVIGKITNLGEDIYRMLDSLKCETRRRQKIFDDFGISKYPQYQRLFYKGRAKEPLPRLVIVADEFAELKQEEPEFISTLISVARIGRSLGIHLILATQKPAGVVSDEIWSNSRFRICLKVQDISDSREMLKKPDAASITQPGRAYMMVGMDEFYALFQSYWSGAPYEPDQSGNLNGNPVRIVTDSGQRIQTVQEEHKRGNEQDELSAVVEYLCKLAQQHGIRKMKSLWRPPLPEHLELRKILDERAFREMRWNENQQTLRVPVGLYDCPELQAQGLQYMDFYEVGHYAVYGARAADRTNLLKTLISSLAAHYAPSEVNIFALDFSSWSLAEFTKYPHVAGVVLSAQKEVIESLMRFLQDEIAARRKCFMDHSVASFRDYRQSVDSHLPAMILLIDNVSNLLQEYPDCEQVLTMVGNTGATFGIYMVFTANSPSSVKYKLQSNVRGAVAFDLTDRADFAAVVGPLEGRTLPKISGRAFYKDQYPIMFQTALYSDGREEAELKKNLLKTAETMRNAWKGPKVRGIPVMPDKVTVEAMEAELLARNTLPLGIQYQTLLPCFMDLSKNFSLIVTGMMHSGKSQFLLSVAGLLQSAGHDNLLYVMDSAAGGLEELKDSAAMYATDQDPAALRKVTLELENQLNERKRAQKKEAETQKNFQPEKFIHDYPQICIFIDDLNELNNCGGDENTTSVERICRYGQDLGVLVFSAVRASDLSRLAELETMTRSMVEGQKAVAISGSASMYPCFQNNLKYSEKTEELETGDALLFDEGNCVKFRRMMP